jgi:hypothetical protein
MTRAYPLGCRGLQNCLYHLVQAPLFTLSTSNTLPSLDVDGARSNRGMKFRKLVTYLPVTLKPNPKLQGLGGHKN